MRGAVITFCSSVGFGLAGWVVPMRYPSLDPWVPMSKDGTLSSLALIDRVAVGIPSWPRSAFEPASSRRWRDGLNRRRAYGDSDPYSGLDQLAGRLPDPAKLFVADALPAIGECRCSGIKPLLVTDVASAASEAPCGASGERQGGNHDTSPNGHIELSYANRAARQPGRLNDANIGTRLPRISRGSCIPQAARRGVGVPMFAADCGPALPFKVGTTGGSYAY